MGPYGKNIKENINIVITDDKFNDAVLRPFLGYKYKGVLNLLYH